MSILISLHIPHICKVLEVFCNAFSITFRTEQIQFKHKRQRFRVLINERNSGRYADIKTKSNHSKIYWKKDHFLFSQIMKLIPTIAFHGISQTMLCFVHSASNEKPGPYLYSATA